MKLLRNIFGVFFGSASENNKTKTKRNSIHEKAHRKNFSSLEIDLSNELNKPQIKRILVSHAKQKCNEISSIPLELREQVAEAVLANYYGQLPEGSSLLSTIQGIVTLTKKDATLIAQDQSKKLSARFDQARQEAIGITEYIWRTVEGKRKIHSSETNKSIYCDHSSREGNKFKWNKPPSGGHPGQSYLCRCYAEGVIDINKILRNASK